MKSYAHKSVHESGTRSLLLLRALGEQHYSATVMTTSREESIAILTETGIEYRYREQLIVQLFLFCVVTGGTVATYSFAQICTPSTLPAAAVAPLLGALTLRMLGWYMGRLNQDRRRAGQIRQNIHEELEWENPHAGYAGKRDENEIRPLPPLKDGERVASYFIRITLMISNSLFLLCGLFLVSLIFGAPTLVCAP